MKIDLMGIKINAETKNQILRQLEGRFKSGQKTFIVTPYSEFFYYAATNYKFRKVLAKADIALPDGITVLWLSYYLSLPLRCKNYYLKILEGFWQIFYSLFFIIFAPKKIRAIVPEKITGSDFFWDLIRLADKNKMKIFLLGGFGETAEIVSKKIREKYSGAAIVGYSNLGPKDDSIEMINASNPDLLMVAYGPVAQETWIAENLKNLNAKIFIGVGGTFDYLAGKKLAPPQFLRKHGLEWAFRLITQPSRAKRIWTATFVFLRGALRHKVLDSCAYRENVASVIINKQNKIFIGLRNTSRYAPDSLMSMELNGKNEHWQLPQGGVNSGETLEQAIKREMMEELSIQNFKILGKASQKYDYAWTNMLRPLFGNSWKNRGQSQTIFYIKYEGPDDAIKLEADEFKGYKWATPEEARQLIHPIRQEMLAVALHDLNKFLGTVK